MDFRYLTESKNEFNNFLCNIMIPHLYSGVSGMLDYSIQTYNLLEEKRKKNKNINNPGIIAIFKMCLGDIATINNFEIESEYKRIKEKSGCIEWFDNLIKASFKSYVLFLTWEPAISNSKYADSDIYDKISIKDFIHKCYIETCNYFIDNPEIFLKKGMRKEIYDIIKNCIETAMKKSLPYNDIIQEYLKINFTADNSKDNNKKEIDNIKNMVLHMISKNKYGTKPVEKAIISETSESYQNVVDNKDNKRQEIVNFINKEEDNNSTHSEHSAHSAHSTHSAHSAHSAHSNKSLKPNIHNNTILNTDDEDEDVNQVNNEYSATSEASEQNQRGGFSKMQVESTPILSRSENRRQELDIVLDKITSNTREVNSSDNGQTDKTKTHDSITSPIPIKKNNKDRIFEDANLKPKKKIQIVRNNANIISDKFENIDNYYNKLMKK
jgi:hypothetical protein